MSRLLCVAMFFQLQGPLSFDIGILKTDQFHMGIIDRAHV